MQIRLPAPSADAWAHSQQLRQQLISMIRQQGPISFAQYMDACLYHPGLGYYSAGATKFGAAGDFVTAPELGSLFAASVAEAIKPCLQQLGSQADIIELGAGSGALAADLLQTLAAAEQLPARYRILELSADLRQRQQAYLHSTLAPALWQRVEWLEQLPATDWHGILLGNEVIDALPATRFAIDGETVLEEYVGLDANEQFQYIYRPASPALEHAVRSLEARLGYALATGYRSELRPQLADWLTALGRGWQRGLAIWIDYGFTAAEYYLPEREQGTLLAYYRHRAHNDPFHLPGLNDLTASVDFSALAAAAAAAAMTVEVYAAQGAWLLASNLQMHFERQYAACTAIPQQISLAQQVRKLTMPEHMGERFGVMLLSRGDSHGFGLQRWAEIDRRHRL